MANSAICSLRRASLFGFCACAVTAHIHIIIVNSFFIISILIPNPLSLIPNPLSLIPNLHSLRYEHAYVLAVLQQFAHGGGTDAGKFRLGEEQDGFYAGQFAVDVGNGFLVFEILHGAYAAYYQTGIYLPGKVDSQAVIGLHMMRGSFR